MYPHSNIRRNAAELAGDAAITGMYVCAAYLTYVTIKDGYNGVFEYFDTGSLTGITELGLTIGVNCFMIKSLARTSSMLRDRLGLGSNTPATEGPEQIR